MKKQYNLLNNIIGWLAFVVAAVTYLLTMEPTTSYWDSGEFIATAFKLEVGHPPGAPFYMILARFFSIFAASPEKVAMMINSLSVISSAVTILFLFWTITHLASKMLIKDGEYKLSRIIAVMGSGLVGALAYTFSDTFWFSAVEAEVYASSSMFTAVVFWAILKWEEQADMPYANRWIIFIAYLMGLSIGVHLLNLLTIPAIVFVYYFRKFDVTKKGIAIAFATSVLLLGLIMYGVIPGIINIAAKFELLAVNGIGLPFNSGIVIYGILLLSGITFGLYYTHKKKKHLFNTIILAFTVILIGYSSFTMIVIRSLANPPMDENNPDNVFALLSYLNREQYGDRPLMYGEYYNAPAVDSKKGSSTYIKKDGKYFESNIREKNVFDSRFETIFPRMYSRQETHKRAYKQWGEVKGRPIRINGEQVYKPTFGENLRFFFSYQIGHMYLRYFMWNFAGRQNDVQGHGGILNGNWISGIPFLDQMMVGNQSVLPDVMKDMKSRNVYYLLPFILGLLGLLFIYNRNQKDFWVLFLLFFFMGIAIVVYLNQYPYQPRERDYAYAGSFYAFSIWIGLGVLFIYNLMKKILEHKTAAISASLIALLLVPVLLAAENWDDHDRSARYTARDFAKNYLESCAKNSILFTFGDNDTFPLWYVQEVEGFRTDVRIVNMSLLSTDWYINQMKQKAYDSDPVPFTLTHDKYIQGTRDQVFVIDRIKEYTDIDKIMQFVGDDDDGTTVPVASGAKYHYLPSKMLRLTVDKEKVIRNGTVAPEMADKIVDNVDWILKGNSLFKSDMMLIDILAANNWERPVYFAVSATPNSYLGLESYFQLEGLAYRLVPIKTTTDDRTIGRVNTEVMYDNIINKFEWGNMKDPKFNMDEYNLRLLSIMKIRNSFARLAIDLINETKISKAVDILDKCIEETPHEQVPFDQFMISIIRAYYICDEFEKGNDVSRKVAIKFIDELRYYNSLDNAHFKNVEREANIAAQVINIIIEQANSFNQNEFADEIRASTQGMY